MSVLSRSAFLACVVVSSGLVAAAPPAQAHAAKRPKLPILTHNVYLGADLTPAIEALAADPQTASPAIQAVWASVQATDFHVRARALASEISKKKPAVVGLQEAVMWRSDTPTDGQYAPPNAATVEYDFVADLVAELKRHGQKYVVAAATTGLDFEVTYLHDDGVTVGDLRLTDRDVVLVRKGVVFANAQTGTYAATLPLPIGGGFPLPRTWASVDLTVKGRTVRFVTTHLEDGVEQISQPQIDELLAGPLDTPLPVVLAGDFNSDPAQAVAPSVVQDVLAGGFADAWADLHPGAAGNTWGESSLLDNVEPQLTQRLDYVFTKGALSAKSIDLVGEVKHDRYRGLWPSDHAGLSAVISLE